MWNYFILTTKKLNRLKKINNSSWIHKRGEEIGQTVFPKIEETGFMVYQSQDSQGETVGN